MWHGLKPPESLWSFGMCFATTLVVLQRPHGAQASQEGLQQQLAEAIAAESFDEAEGLQAEVDAAAAEIISLGGTPAESPADSAPEVIVFPHKISIQQAQMSYHVPCCLYELTKD